MTTTGSLILVPGSLNAREETWRMKRVGSILVPFRNTALDLELITHSYGEETTWNLWNLNMFKVEFYWTSRSATWIHRVSSNLLMAKSVLIIFRLGGTTFTRFVPVRFSDWKFCMYFSSPPYLLHATTIPIINSLLYAIQRHVSCLG
jgi:hypothetical protein